MLEPRVIPCLLLKGKGLVKGVKFKNHRYLGDPINIVQLFNTMEVDELLFLDITATPENRIPYVEIIQKISDQCLMPFGVGGGIKSVDDAKIILQSGAEKICLNTAAIDNPNLITEIAKNFGSQSVVVSVDYKYNIFGKPVLYSHCGSKKISVDFFKFIKTVETAGAGEILLNSIDKDGSMAGYDLTTIQKVSSLVNIPIIVCGGAGSLTHLKQGVKAGASAVAAGSLFVFHGPRRAVLISYPNQKQLNYIKNQQPIKLSS